MAFCSNFYELLKDPYDIQLIENVQKHEFLYNPGLSDHHDQILCNETWEKIGKLMLIAGNRASRRWESLCRSFSNAKQCGHNCTKNHLGHVYFWKYKKEMSFVLPFLENRKDLGTASESPSRKLGEPKYCISLLSDNEQDSSDGQSADMEASFTE